MRITTSKSVCIGVLTAGLVLTLCVEAQETRFPDPVFPFGAVYFRKSNPPEQDWERDHKTAAQMGVNIFRHWFMWASIENSPGRYQSYRPGEFSIDAHMNQWRKMLTPIWAAVLWSRSQSCSG